MTSSISSSDERGGGAPRRAIAAMLIGVALLGVGLELGTRYVVTPSSATESRIVEEVALATRPAESARIPVLMVGNSLLLDAVDMPFLRNGMESQYDVRRVVIEQTTYLDWVYGLRALRELGSPASVELVFLDIPQLVSLRPRGEYLAARLLTPKASVQVGVEAGLHPTDISRIVTSSMSDFYGIRAETRKFALFRLFPEMERLAPLLRPAVGTQQPQAQFERVDVVRAHIRRLSDESLRRCARLTLVVPPTKTGVSPDSAMLRGLVEDGLPVLAPPATIRFYSADFSDEYHLSTSGRDKYTVWLRDALSTALAGRSPACAADSGTILGAL